MSRVCTICSKRPMSGNQISKSRRHTKRRWLPNLQRVRVQTAEGPRRIRICTKCLRERESQQSYFKDACLGIEKSDLEIGPIERNALGLTR